MVGYFGTARRSPIILNKYFLLLYKTYQHFLIFFIYNITKIKFKGKNCQVYFIDALQPGASLFHINQRAFATTYINQLCIILICNYFFLI